VNIILIICNALPFLVDVIQKNDRWLQNNVHTIGSRTIDHIENVVRELTRLSLGTEFDARTTRAFAEAKEALGHPEVVEESA